MIQPKGDGTTPASTRRIEAPAQKGSYRRPETAIAHAIRFTGLKSMIFLGGGGVGIIAVDSALNPVYIALRTLAKRSKRFAPLLAAPAALLLSQGQAKAVLIYNIFESGGNVVVQTSGSLDLSGTTPVAGEVVGCGINGLIKSAFGAICSGVDTGFSGSSSYPITGPTSFIGTADITPASSVSGTSTVLYGLISVFRIDSSYASNSPIVSSATFNSLALSSLGFTTTGLIGTWTIDGTSESINVYIGPPAAAPGPLPLLGAGAAFGWSRRLRKRITAPLSTLPQA